MQSWLTRSLFIGGIFSLVWLAVIYNWRASNRMPNGTEVALYFIVLPIAVLITLWLAVKAWSFATGTPSTTVNPSAISPGANVSGEGGADEHAAVNERTLSIAVLAGAIRTAHGSSAEELAAKLKANEARLDLDPELKNRDGFPVLTGRMAGIDEEAQVEALSAWSALTGRVDFIWSVEQLRAISVGSEVAIELAQQAVKHSQIEPYISAIAKNRELPPLPMLQLITILPENWGDEKRQFVIDWIAHLIQQQGWPAEMINLRPVVQTLLTRAMTAIDQLMLDSFRLSHPCFGMVIACESYLGEDTIQEWEDAGKLFAGKTGNVQMPGEGAAGMLLADETQAQLMASETNVRLHRIVKNYRSKSIDARGNVTDPMLEEMIHDALTISKISANKIAFISSDTDQRSSRVVELMGVGIKMFPDLDPTTQYCKLAGNCGDMGAVTSLAALVLGHFQVVSDAEPSLCISNIDSHERTVAVLSPWVDAVANSVTNSIIKT